MLTSVVAARSGVFVAVTPLGTVPAADVGLGAGATLIPVPLRRHNRGLGGSCLPGGPLVRRDLPDHKLAPGRGASERADERSAGEPTRVSGSPYPRGWKAPT